MSPDMRNYIYGFLEENGIRPSRAEIRPLQADGSKREFWRVIIQDAARSFVAMSNPPIDGDAARENFAYAMIGNHLRRKGVPAPELYRFDLARGWFVMEDLGAVSLQEAVLSSSRPLPLYERALEALFRLQVQGADGFDASWCCQTERYDRHVMQRLESEYFKNAFLVLYLGMERNWAPLEAAFRRLAENAAKADNRFLIHRDFQSRNIMVRQNGVGLVDWQGARLGPLAYDFASLLIDPYTDLPSNVRSAVWDSYLRILQAYDKRLVEPFKATFPYLALQRNLQILGAFAFLTKARGKRHFEAYIPGALRNLGNLLEELGDRELAPLEEVVRDAQALLGASPSGN